MSLILFIAVALALAVEEWIEAGVIGFIIVLNTVVGFLQVRKKGKGKRGIGDKSEMGRASLGAGEREGRRGRLRERGRGRGTK